MLVCKLEAVFVDDLLNLDCGYVLLNPIQAWTFCSEADFRYIRNDVYTFCLECKTNSFLLHSEFHCYKNCCWQSFCIKQIKLVIVFFSVKAYWNMPERYSVINLDTSPYQILGRVGRGLGLSGRGTLGKLIFRTRRLSVHRPPTRWSDKLVKVAGTR